VTYPEGTVRDIQINGLTAANFDSMMYEIIAASEKVHEERRSLDMNAPAALVEGPDGPEIPFGGIRFIFPKEQWDKKLHSDLMTKSVVTILICLVFYITIVAGVLSNTPMSENVVRGLLITAGCFLVICSIIVLSFRKSYTNTIRTVPGTIRIEKNAIQIDDAVFPASDIQYLHMSPVTFDGVSGMPLGLRKLKIETAGRNYDYILGHFYMSKSTVLYQDYGTLLTAVGVFLKQAGKSISWIEYNSSK
jgi:hypothetical protein